MIGKLQLLCFVLLALACALAAETPAQAARQFTTANQPKLTQEFSEFLSIPNVAADPANLKRNADTLVEMLKKRNVEARLLSILGAPPVVYGEITVPGARHTIVFYAHYDGQPVTASEWEGGSPFTPVIREVDGEPRIYARSAGDDKAAIFAQLTALAALQAARIPLRANIRFVWEGEEEAGSPHLEQILDANRDLCTGTSGWYATARWIRAGNRLLFSGREATRTLKSRSTVHIMACTAVITGIGLPIPR
ncbi:MAG TPA: M20/M25/M40 family metallo-hydrolase [Terracidiphilus sp.]